MYGIVYMNSSNVFTKLRPSIFTFIFYAAFFIALTFAIKKLDISAAYAI